VRKPAAIGTSAGIVKFSDKRKSQGDKRKSQSVNGVVGPVSTTATVLVSVKVANMCAPRNDGVAAQEVSLNLAYPIFSKRSRFASFQAAHLALIHSGRFPDGRSRSRPALRMSADE
jgi:hypothetical protein